MTAPLRHPLATTLGDLAGTLSSLSASRMEPAPQERREVLVNDERVGWLTTTTRTHPGMRWYWEALGSYGYAASKPEAIAEMIEWLERRLPEHWADQRDEAEEQARMAAMSPDVREAYQAMKQAGVALEVERRRIIQRPDDLRAAEEWHRKATARFEAAQAKMEAA